MNNELNEKFAKAIENLKKRFATVRAGRANPSSLDGVMVEYYGVLTPLKQLATISVPDARQLLIKPFDRSALAEIEKAIITSNLGYTPSNDGESVRISIPQLTEERRVELTKQVKALAEDAKIAIRNLRREAIDEIETDDLSDDEKKSGANDIQDLVNKYNKIVDDKLKEKEQELMTV